MIYADLAGYLKNFLTNESASLLLGLLFIIFVYILVYYIVFTKKPHFNFAHDFKRDNKKITVFISGPYSAPTYEGVEAYIQRARKAAMILAGAGLFYICPHLNSAHFESEVKQKDSYYYELALHLLEFSQVVLVLPGYLNSPGTLGEIETARKDGKPVYIIKPEQWANNSWIADFTKWLENQTFQN